MKRSEFLKSFGALLALKAIPSPVISGIEWIEKKTNEQEVFVNHMTIQRKVVSFNGVVAQKVVWCKYDDKWSYVE